MIEQNPRYPPRQHPPRCYKTHPITFITIAKETPPPPPPPTPTTSNTTRDSFNKSSEVSSNTSLTKGFSLDDDSHAYLQRDDCSDPTADLISYGNLPMNTTSTLKGLSADMSSDFTFFTLPPPELERTFDHSMKSTSDGCSDTVISSLTLDDDLSIGSSIPPNYLCHTRYHDGFPKKHHKSLNSSKNTKSCESTAASSGTTTQQSEQTSNPRITDLKQKLRSIESRFYHKRHTTTNNHSTTRTPSHPNNLNRTRKLHAIYKSIPMIKSVLQIIGECIMVNIVLYIVYLILVFYKYSFLMAIQGGSGATAVYSTTLAQI